MGHPSPTITTTAPPLLRPLLSLDATISHYLHTLARPLTPKPLLVLLEILADFRFFFPVALSLFFATPPSSPLRKHLLFPLLVCSLLDLIFIALVKFLVRRSRPPYANHEEYNAVVSVDNFSFPSGHSSRVCFIASLFYFSQAAILNAVADLKACGYPRVALFIDQWIGGNEMMAVNLLVLVVCIWALVTAVSRIILGRHYVLDVFVGSCLGVLEALFTIQFLRFQDICCQSSEEFFMTCANLLLLSEVSIFAERDADAQTNWPKIYLRGSNSISSLTITARIWSWHTPSPDLVD